MSASDKVGFIGCGKRALICTRALLALASVLGVLTPALFAGEPAYIAELGSPDAKERRDAIESARTALSPNFDPKTEKWTPSAEDQYRPQVKAALLKLLDDADGEVQGAALEMLAIEFRKEVAGIEEKVLGMTQSKSGAVRRSVLKYFDQLRYYTRPATPRAKLGQLFLAALSDPVPEVRADAASSITAFHGGDVDLVAALTKLLKDSNVNTRAMAVYALIHCPDLPAETMTEILAQKDDPAAIMKELYTQMMPILVRKTGPQRWQNARIVRSNPYGLGRIWIELDRPLIGGQSCTVVVSANGTIPTQYAPVPEGRKADSVPIDAVWFEDGNAIALIYPKDVPDVVLSWDDGALASAADSAQAQFINPKQRPMTAADRDALRLGGKEEYLAKLAADRAKHALQRRFVLWPSGKLRSEWHVYEANDGMYAADGGFGIWFESGQQNEKGSYGGGKLDGRIQEWDIRGEIVTDGIWAAGKPQSGLCRDLADSRRVKQYRDGSAIPAVDRK